ncbi:MAG: zinc-ribbon domain-containing protein [Proteobacteria bacterium]|nr:zinc-ribbon domain-containing protein [Pseudomonadota bacterium]
MLVKCDKCGQGYEVNESRISSQGAKIKCPSCGNVFLVQLSNGVATVSSNQLDAVASFYEDDKKQEAEESWRVRHMGLTYTFHDISSLQDWLSGRPSLDDVKVAKNEDDWKELGDYPNVMTAELIMKFFPLGDVPKTGSKSASAALASSGLEKKPGLGGGLNVNNQMANDPIKDAKKAKQIARARKEEQKRIEEETKSFKKRIKILVIILVIVFVGVGVFIWVQKGILDVPDVLNINGNKDTMTQEEKNKQLQQEFNNVKNTSPEAVQARLDNPDGQAGVGVNMPTDEEIRQAAEAEIKNRIKEAADMVKNKRWPEARATLETIVEEQPDNLEAMQLLYQTYRGLSLEKQASELDGRIKKLKAKLAEEAKKAGEVFEGGDWEE